MVNLRRATSAGYYALFHCLARECANLLIGGPGASRHKEAWQQVYRSLEHRTAKERCRDTRSMKRFPKPIDDFADLFVKMQDKRHDADYDPFATFSKSDVETDIAAAEDAIARFTAVDTKDRRAFCAHVLLRKRT